MRIVNDQMELALAYLRKIDRLIETFNVATEHINVAQDLNGSNIIEIDTTIIFAEEEVFDLTFGCFINVQTILIKELDIDNTLIMGCHTDMHAAYRIGIANIVARNWHRHLIDIVHVDTSRRHTRIDTALDHTRGTMSVAVETDDRASGQNRPISCTKACCELRRQINIDQTRNAIATEEATASL